MAYVKSTATTGSSLASTATGEGAAQVGIEDSLSRYAAVTVEGALAESSTNVAALTTPIVGFASVSLAGVPVGTNHVTIDGEKYEFVAAAGDVGNDLNIAVEASGVAATDAAALVAAINGTAAAAHATVFLIGGVTPALGAGTKALFAQVSPDITTLVLVTSAVTQGVDPSTLTTLEWESEPTAAPSMVLSETLNGGAAWSVANLNAIPWHNPEAAPIARCTVTFTVTAEMLTAATVYLKTSLTTMLGGSMTILKSDVVVSTAADKLGFSNGYALVTLAGAATDAEAGDVIMLQLYGTV